MSMAEPIWLGALRRGLQGRTVGGMLRWLPRTPSTNDAAREWLDRGGPDGLVVIADGQSAARGRRGRRWISPEGCGLYLSVGLRPDLAGASAARLMLLGAVATAETLRALNLRAEIRWPNDIDVNGRKIAGVLAESRIDGERVSSAVLGIGVNLRHGVADFPPELHGHATSVLLERGPAPTQTMVTAKLLERLETWYARLDAAESCGDSLVDRWRELAPGHHGARVTVDGEGERFDGVTRGLGPDGALLVQPDDGKLVAVRLGELVRVRPTVGGEGC